MEAFAFGVLITAVVGQAAWAVGAAIFAPEKLKNFSVSEHIKRYWFSED